MKSSVISRHPDVMSGAVVFAGTRVPVQTLLDYIGAGDSIDDFLEGFPSVSLAQVVAVLDRPVAIDQPTSDHCAPSSPRRGED